MVALEFFLTGIISCEWSSLDGWMDGWMCNGIIKATVGAMEEKGVQRKKDDTTRARDEGQPDELCRDGGDGRERCVDLFGLKKRNDDCMTAKIV